MGTVDDIPPTDSAFTSSQIQKYLKFVNLPTSCHQYIDSPHDFPKSIESLTILMRCQITSFPYENLSVHYSPSHVVNIDPNVVYTKMMGVDGLGRHGRGGYCMEISIFFYHILRGLGFDVYMTGVRNRWRIDGVPQGEYKGWTHIVNIVHLPSGTKYHIDVAFGGDGPTSPLPLLSGHLTQNLGTQDVRLVRDNIPKQKQKDPKLWIYQYRNGPDNEWSSYYSFAEIEFFQDDFEVMNWFTSFKSIHRWTVIVVRFLRKGHGVIDTAELPPTGAVNSTPEDEVRIAGKVMLVNNTVKLNLGGKTQIVESFETEEERIMAFQRWFNIHLTPEEVRSIENWDIRLGLA